MVIRYLKFVFLETVRNHTCCLYRVASRFLKRLVWRFPSNMRELLQVSAQVNVGRSGLAYEKNRMCKAESHMNEELACG